MPNWRLRGSFACAAVASGLAATGLAAFAATGSGMAQVLPPEQCKTIAVEHEALVKAGVPETMKKGPVWAKANLPADKLKDVERYIGLEEQLLFRCGLAKARKLPGAGPDEGEGAEAEPAAAPPPRRKPAHKLPAKTPAKAKSDTAAEADPPAPRPKPKPHAKAKADDAYRPPDKAAEPAEQTMNKPGQ